MPLSTSWWFKRRPRTRARVCPGCGVLLDPGDRTCFQCGARVTPASFPGVRLWLKRTLNLEGEATWGIFVLNLILFLVTWLKTKQPGPLMGVDLDVLDQFGAKVASRILAGEWWRLVTSMFLHANVLHFFFNMWVFLDLGRFAENLYGWPRYLFFYVMAGVAGSVASALVHPEALGVGASGAILGMAGVLLAYSVRHWRSHGKYLGGSLLRWLLYILLIGFFLSSFVDNAAHLGGLLTGFLIALPFPTEPPKTSWQRWFYAMLGWGALLALCGSFAWMAFPRGS